MVGLICISLITRNFEHIFMCLLAGWLYTRVDLPSFCLYSLAHYFFFKSSYISCNLKCAIQRPHLHSHYCATKITISYPELFSYHPELELCIHWRVSSCLLWMAYQNILEWNKVKVLVNQSCPTLWDPMDCPWNSPGENTGMGCHSLFQEIFLTQGLNPDFLHCKQILYHLSCQGSPS